MKPVIQKERTGCGIASAAALAGVSYIQAKRVANHLGIFAEDERLWSEVSPVQKVLAHFRIKTACAPSSFRSWKTLPNLALLSTKWHLEKGRPFWHWVVFVRENGREYILDSKQHLRNHRRTDFGRIKPKWFLEVRARG